MKKRALISALFFVIPFLVYAFDIPTSPVGYVNDYAHVLQEDVKQKLEQDLSNFTASTSNEIAVVIIPELGSDTIEHYANTLFSTWKIGNEKNDNGVLLLISINDRKVRIEVGYGLEGAIPDILAKNIITTKITPSFKQGDYATGVTLAVEAIKEASRGEYTHIEKKPNFFSSVSGNTIEILLVFLFFALQYLSSILARSKSWWAGGIVGGVLGGVITFFNIFGTTLAISGVITGILVILGLLFDYVVSNTYQNRIQSGGSSLPWWIGGGNGSSGGSDSFGGFGGGDSGGGGASGDW
ncbi:MAG: TPM domain-containing protein [Candidatus Pacebacteria bacterium]|nr:TPM domain-containing protein [Candidatus Paceibacterota bacterium]MBP9866515.1 TPM domain-containing protein [Candidatus Paceibacterota bacterium]